MVTVLALALLAIGTVASLVWRARRCSAYGCGVQELKP